MGPRRLPVGLLWLCCCLLATAQPERRARAKRHIAFPRGSNVQLVYCLTIGAEARRQGDLVLGLTAALAWELPSKVERELPAGLLHRRSRAALYPKIEAFLQSAGLGGGECVLRALCEAGQRSPAALGTGDFLQELLHAVFTWRGGADGEDQRRYERAHRSARDCRRLYASCRHSIYDLAL